MACLEDDLSQSHFLDIALAYFTIAATFVFLIARGLAGRRSDSRAGKEQACPIFGADRLFVWESRLQLETGI
jgi:hypothetical protein